jgi:hypothetical protein
VLPHGLALVLALGSKETGVVIAPVITLWTLLRRIDVGADRAKGAGLLRDLARVTPSWALSAAYLAARGSVLRSVRGADSGAPGLDDPLRVFASLARYLQNLLPFRLGSTIRNLPFAEARSLGFLLTAALTAAASAALLAWLARRRIADALGLAGWLLIALAPVLLVGTIGVPGIAGKYPLADRWLYHALGAASVLAVLLFARLPWPRVQQGILVAAAGWAAIVIAVNESVRAEYVSDSSMLATEDRSTYFATPPEFRTPEDECRFLDRQFFRATQTGDLTSALAQADLSLERCRDDVPTRTLNRFTALVGLRRFDAARPLAEALVERPPADPRGHSILTHLAGITFLETGAPELAERWLLASRQLGDRSCDIGAQLARVALAKLEPDRASQYFEAVYACGGSRDPGPLIDAARWSVYAGQPGRARKLLARIRQERANDAPLERQVAQLEAQIARMAAPQ